MHHKIRTPLDIRCDYILACLKFHITNSEDDRDEVLNCIEDAECYGRYSYDDNISSVPLLFVGISELENAWHYGYDCKAKSDEMRHCSYCHDDTGNPCPVHG